VALYLNQGVVTKGTLSFAAPTLFNVGYQPSSIATADFRANGITDVVVRTSFQRIRNPALYRCCLVTAKAT
jgi:hypothetical protein